MYMQLYAQQLGIPYLEASAKNATNVQQIFLTMAAEMNADDGSVINNSAAGPKIKITSTLIPPPQKSGCC